MSQIQAGEVFTDVAPGKTVSSTRLNNHVNGGLLLNGAIQEQNEKLLPVAADTLLLGDSTLTPAAAPKKVQIQNLLLESQRNGTQQYAVDSGTANTYVVTLAPVATAYTAGMTVRIKASNANTGVSTLNVNGLGAKTIKSRAGADLAANDLLAGEIVTLVYDGTYFQIEATGAGGITATQVTENLRTGENQYATDTGSANTYAVAPTPAITAYTAGLTVRFTAAGTNTGASTLNVNSLGIKTLKRIVAGAVADLAARDIQAGDLVTCVYDGTYFQITGRVRSWDFVSSGTTSLPGSSAAAPIAHGLGAMPTKLRAVLVQTNASPDNGYNQNDEVGLDIFQNTSTNMNAFAVTADATNVTVAQTSNANLTVIPKTGGGHTDITETNWRIKVYASL